MAKFVPEEKLSKKARKELNLRRRVTWDFSPVTKTVDSRKIYSRKRKARNRDDADPGFLLYNRRAGSSPAPLMKKGTAAAVPGEGETLKTLS